MKIIIAASALALGFALSTPALADCSSNCGTGTKNFGNSAVFNVKAVEVDMTTQQISNVAGNYYKATVDAGSINHVHKQQAFTSNIALTDFVAKNGVSSSTVQDARLNNTQVQGIVAGAGVVIADSATAFGTDYSNLNIVAKGDVDIQKIQKSANLGFTQSFVGVKTTGNLDFVHLQKAGETDLNATFDVKDLKSTTLQFGTAVETNW